MRSTLGLLAFVFLAACGEDPDSVMTGTAPGPVPPGDTQPGVDGGARGDGGLATDGGFTDGGIPGDGGGLGTDAGGSLDAGPGFPDSGIFGP